MLVVSIRAVVRLKSAEVRGKLFEYIVNPSSSAQNTERHVSSTDMLGKRYRNMAPVFSIDDDHDGGKHAAVLPRSDTFLILW